MTLDWYINNPFGTYVGSKYVGTAYVQYCNLKDDRSAFSILPIVRGHLDNELTQVKSERFLATKGTISH